MKNETVALLPCPFCGCTVQAITGFEYVRIRGDHAECCVFLDDDPIIAEVAEWNTRAALADPVPMCSTPTGARCPGDGVNECKKCPVPPAGGEPEVIVRYSESCGEGGGVYPNRKGELCNYAHVTRLQVELREMDDENTRLLNERSRLQAEVERLTFEEIPKHGRRLLEKLRTENAALQSEVEKFKAANAEISASNVRRRDRELALQSELTKARELLSESLPALEQAASAFKAAKPVRNKVRAYLANQSAPAAKDGK